MTLVRNIRKDLDYTEQKREAPPPSFPLAPVLILEPYFVLSDKAHSP